MCGIAGIYSAGYGSTREAVAAMIAQVRHRGPDDEGVVLFSGSDATPVTLGGSDTPAECYASTLPYAPVPDSAAMPPASPFLALGHRRLAIVDVSPGGHQPMCSADRRLWIVFNGEIYNYVELRQELAKLGHDFQSRSDTEVILAAYRQWGQESLRRLNGMFAFLLFDRATGKLFAARDRFGVKPLYYWISPTGFVAFASEIKQFTVLPGWEARINGQRAYDFLNWARIDHTGETLFSGVRQLRNGEALELNLAGNSLGQAIASRTLPVFTWYRLRPGTCAMDFGDAAEHFRGLLQDSTRLRLRADVPVGSCLSGGLDSSSVVCLMNGLLREQDAHALQRTFSAYADVPRFDEREYVEQVVRRTGADAHHIVPMPRELFAELGRIAWHQDEPFGSTSIYAQWCVFRLAAQHGVKVMLDGQGADEQLAGYHSYFWARLAELFYSLRWHALGQEVRAIHERHGYPNSWALRQALNVLLPEFLRPPLRCLSGKTDTAPAWLDLAALGATVANPFPQVSGGDAVYRLSHDQLTRSNLQMLLHWEDRDSMAHSVETRLPFLDYRLVEFALGLPAEFKIADGVTKRVLREGLRDVLPERIRTRMDKLGFATPEEEWLRSRYPDWFRKALRDAVEASNGILNGDAALQMLERMISGATPFHFLPWRMISFGAWIRAFGIRP